MPRKSVAGSVPAVEKTNHHIDDTKTHYHSVSLFGVKCDNSGYRFSFLKQQS